MKKILIVVGIILAAALISGASFWGGMTYQTKQAESVRANFFNARGGQLPGEGQFPANGQLPSGAQGQQGQGSFRGGGAFGEVKSIEGNVLTLSTAQNVTTVNLTDATKILKTIDGATSDLQPGMRVVVAGQRDDKGNITASQITIESSDTSTTRTAP